MTTRSGRKYKQSESDMESLQEMMKALIDERHKREEEIAAERVRREEEMAAERARREEEMAAERARREEEIVAERARREEERVARERDVKQQMEAMQTQMERLLKVVEVSKPTAAKAAGELSVKLVPLSEKDDIEAYLVTFERIMEAHKVPESRWPHYLAPQLTGRAQLAFVALPITESAKYPAIRNAILARYDINEEAYRRRFRTATRGPGQTNRELAVRQMDLQKKWLKDATTVEEVQEKVGIEQFLSTLPVEQKLWVTEKKPKTCIHTGELADEYEQARREGSTTGVVTELLLQQQPQQQKQAKPREQKICSFCKKIGHVEQECRKKKREQATSSTPGRSEIQCFNCQKMGHIASKCPGKTNLFCGEQKSAQETNTLGIYREGLVEGHKVEKILLDTGCSRTMIQRSLVPQNKFLEGQAVTIRCAHGDTVLYPLAEVDLEIDGLPIRVEAAVSDSLPVAVLLGTDVPEMSALLGQESEPKNQQDVMVVVTRAQARQQLEGELLRREREIQSGAKPNPVGTPAVKDSAEGSTAEGSTSTNVPVTKLTRKQRRALRKGFWKGREEDKPSLHSLDMSAEGLKQLQDEDETLTRVKEAANGHPNTAGVGFFKRDGLIYRKWIPPGRGEEMSIEQLVLPKECRKAVLEVAHEIPLAGHLGKEKTRQRILQRFYWPTVFKDVENFCKSCVICQKTANRKAPKAPMIPLPIISEPFSRIAMDIVGPLPRSRAGNKYVLVICDYATRYPEAVPLKSIDAEHVAEELIKVFARVGVPQEILTDQGSNFTSQLLAELYRLLHVHPIRTSPYHPQTDGLVERFNQTLKSMLRRTAAGDGKDWDKYIPYLLFAYREVPQASTGFSPFELVYGRSVRGPLDVLRETWEANQQSEESIVSYILSTREKLKQMSDIVQENVQKSQDTQKRWYDKNARFREFGPGDPVLVLLPTSSSKLLAQWMGPYQVVKRVGAVTYLVDMHDRRKRRRIFHVNMLKEFHVRQAAETSYWTEENPTAEADSEIPVWNEKSQGEPSIGEQLDEQQKEQLQFILKEFEDVMKAHPGQTDLVEHKIPTGDAHPVRLPPYRLPQAYRDTVAKELKEMEEDGIIAPSSSEWSFPIVLVKKKDGSLRMCVDYRRLNSSSPVDAYPMPRIDDIIDRLGEAKYISTLDLTRGYWQVPVAPEDQCKTAFVTPFGLYQYKVMPFGLKGAPATFQRLMDKVINGLQEFSAAYLDDIVIFSNTWEAHTKHLRAVLQRLRMAGLTGKPSKCQFAQRECTYLGHVVGSGTVRPHPSKIESVQQFKIPETKQQVRAFLGLTGYYRRFIPDYAALTVPLTDLTRKGAPNEVSWNKKCEDAFEKLKQLLCSSPILRSPDFSRPFILQTDASDRGVGAVLSQESEDGEEHPVGYFSRKLLPREERYATVEKECLAIKLGVQAFRVYLLGRHFTIQTDHRSLQWLDRLKETNSRLTRWSLALQPYQFTVQHRAGTLNQNADAFSRITTK